VHEAKRLPELVAQIHRHAHDDDHREPSADPTEPWRTPHQRQTQRAKGRHREHQDPHGPIVPLEKAALAVATVAAGAVSRLQGMPAAPAAPGMAHRGLGLSQAAVLIAEMERHGR
jgi:hypothetical protein